MLFSHRSNFPLTDLICDGLRMESGLMTKQELREKWKDGGYPGVSAEHAKWYVEGRR